MIVLKSNGELRRMRRAGLVVWRALELVREHVKPGVTTGHLNRLVEEMMAREGAVPSFKGYHGYPASICTSVDEQVVHGIPGDRILHEGQIVSVDIGAIVDGYHGDAARTFPVGAISAEAQRLLDVTWQALQEGIRQARVGNHLSDISHAIQTYAEAAGFSVVRDYVGHGIGRQMHEPPQIPNYGPPGMGPKLRAGMVLAIEPMVNAGTYEVRTLEDQWTVVTVDGALSAHFENTVAITPEGPAILTEPEPTGYE